MTTQELIESATKESFTDAKGNACQLRLKPGLSGSQMEEMKDRLRMPLPNEIRELLGFTSGFSFQPFGEVGLPVKGLFGLEEVLPVGLPVAADGCGNAWMVDVKKDTGRWGTVMFMSHDPPVAVIQAADLAGFIQQVLDLGRPKRKSLLDFVQETATNRIWNDDPYLMDVGASRISSDPVLAGFSRGLPETFRVADLRGLEVGSGFAWGRNGPNSAIRRCGSELLFGAEVARISFWSRLLKR